MKRRDVIKGLLGVSGAAAAGISLDVASISEKAIPSPVHAASTSKGIITTSNIPMLLKDGLDKIFNEEYGRHEAEWDDNLFNPSRLKNTKA